MALARVLIVEDDRTIAQLVTRWLGKESCQVEHVLNGEDALRKLVEKDWDLVLLDYVLPGMSGLEVIKAIKKKEPDLPVMFMTGNMDVRNAVEAMREGAHDYLIKPLDRDELLLKTEKIMELRSLKWEIKRLKQGVQTKHQYANIVAESPAMRDIMGIIKTVAQSRAETMVLLGESGVGKNLIAQAIHYNSERASGPFLSVTCTAIPESLLESELFGHVRGAFTDAKASKKGYCEQADGGTFFLDEIGDMPLGLQSKLLGFLETRTFRRVGGGEELHADVRVIAATNRNLKEDVEAGRFRSDLYYRLNVIELNLPPLRDRAEDIPHLINLFISQFNKRFRKNIRGAGQGAVDALCRYRWPGNVRELRNMIERAMILTQKETLDLDDFPTEVAAPAEPAEADRKLYLIQNAEDEEEESENLNLADHEETLVKKAMKAAGGNQTKAAVLLGITRNQLLYRMKKYNIA